MPQQTCDELVALVREKGPKAIRRMDWLDEIVDTAGAAEFTGLKVEAVRAYHTQANRKRAELEALPDGDPRRKNPPWMWPAPDKVLGRSPGWKLRTLVLNRAEMPGRGAGGGRPWPAKAAAGK